MGKSVTGLVTLFLKVCFPLVSQTKCISVVVELRLYMEESSGEIEGCLDYG